MNRYQMIGTFLILVGGLFAKLEIQSFPRFHNISPIYTGLSFICIVFGIVYLFITSEKITSSVKNAFHIMLAGIIFSILIYTLTFFLGGEAVFVTLPLALIVFTVSSVISFLLIVKSLIKGN